MTPGTRSAGQPISRRRCLVGAGGLVSAGLVAGCLGDGDADDNNDTSPWSVEAASQAVSWDDLGDLEGELTIYSGRTRDQIDPLFDQLREEYPDLDLRVDWGDNDAQVNAIIQEGENTHADIFYTQDSGALSVVKDEGLFRELPSDIDDALDPTRTDPDGVWMGVSGRVRAVMYNTDQWQGDATDLPTDIMAYATDDRFEDIISTRPNSGSFRAFIVAMMELEGEEETREWVRSMVEDQHATLYSGGTEQVEGVRTGEVTVALGNQYYAARVLEEDPDAPIDVTFTRNDAGSLFNVSGIGITTATSNASLAAEVARHLIAQEGQEFFVHTNGEYPVVDGVDYVGDLPPVDEVDPPDFDLNRLGLELQEASDLLRQEGMIV